MMSGIFFSSRRRHTRWPRDWSSDVCSSDLEVEGVAIPLAISAIEAEAQAEIESEVFCHAPIVLEIGFYDSVAIVIFGLEIDLRELRNLAHEQVRKGVSRAGNRCIAGIERQNTLDIG